MHCFENVLLSDATGCLYQNSRFMVIIGFVCHVGWGSCKPFTRPCTLVVVAVFTITFSLQLHVSVWSIISYSSWTNIIFCGAHIQHLDWPICCLATKICHSDWSEIIIGRGNQLLWVIANNNISLFYIAFDQRSMQKREGVPDREKESTFCTSVLCSNNKWYVPCELSKTRAPGQTLQ